MLHTADDARRCRIRSTLFTKAGLSIPPRHHPPQRPVPLPSHTHTPSRRQTQGSTHPADAFVGNLVKILIADQSKTMRTIIRRTLRQAGMGGHEMLEASHGREALDMLLDHEPTLALSDWHLPGLDGLKCLAQARDAGSTAKFGFVTTAATTEFRELARDAGAAFVISKPFTVEMFEYILAPLLLNGEAEVPQNLAPVDLHDMLLTLCNKPCRVDPVTYWEGDDAVVAASYVNGDGAVRGALFAEAGFACTVAAATNLAPPGVAHYATAKNFVPGQLQDCVRELVNILGGILNQQRNDHLVLKDVWVGDSLPTSVESLLSGECRVITYDVRVTGYGSGRVTLANDLSVF